MPSTPPNTQEMIAEMVAEPSVSCVDPDMDSGNAGVNNKLADWLEDLGFKVRLDPIGEGKTNLVAQLGEGEDGLVFSGHTDTVPFDDSNWDSDPFKLSARDGRLYGLGTTDMKAFLALAVEAARGYRADQLKHPLMIVATADEETTMDGAKQLVSMADLPARYCVIGEPTNMQPVRTHKGILMEALSLTGQSGHSSNPAYGNNALEGMHKAIHALHEWRDGLNAHHQDHHFEVPGSTLNLGQIHGGDNPNRICPFCQLKFDLRFLPGMAAQALRAEFRAFVEERLANDGFKIEWEALFDGIPAFQTGAESELVRFAESLTGHGAQAVAFGTEAPYFSELGIETIVLGPGEVTTAHQPNENLRIDRIQPTVDQLRQMIDRFCLA